jgi:hypothetical protein
VVLHAARAAQSLSNDVTLVPPSPVLAQFDGAVDAVLGWLFTTGRETPGVSACLASVPACGRGRYARGCPQTR